MDSTLTIAALGDSITQGLDVAEPKRWTTLVETGLRGRYPEREVRVINAGVGGNTSREGLARLRNDVLTHKPNVVLVEFGGNDATPEQDRHVSLEEFHENLHRMSGLIGEATGARRILLTFPPIVNAWHGWTGNALFDGFGGPDGYVEQYREVTRAYARDHGLMLIDIDKVLRDAMANHGAETYIMRDGVHLTEDGNVVVAQAIMQLL